MIEIVSAASLRGILARVVHWYKVKGREEIDDYPPPEVVQDILANPTLPFPELLGITDVPVFSKSGELQTATGYSSLTKQFYAPGGLKIRPVNADPTSGELQEARAFIEELLCDFPFVSSADKANAFAAILQPFARPLIEGPTPLYAVDAPTPGTGKTLLAQVIAVPACGLDTAVFTLSADDDEARKRITSLLMKGGKVNIIDNLARKLDSAPLAALLTSTTWEDRLLGVSRAISLPNGSTWIASGNNVELSLEIARRVVRVRLDTRAERPWLGRKFKHDLPSWAIQNREHLVWACLTLISGWVAAGRPAGVETLGMFESWSATMGGILALAEIPDFLRNAQELYDVADEEGQSWRGFTGAWFSFHASKPVAASVLVGDAESSGIDLGDGSERSKQTKLGKLLKANRDRQFGNFRIQAASSQKGSARWRVLPGVDEQHDQFGLPGADLGT